MNFNYYQLLCIQSWNKERPQHERSLEAKLLLCESIDRPIGDGAIEELSNILRCVAILAHELNLDLEQVARSNLEGQNKLL